MKTYNEFSNKSASKKLTLVHLDMKREVKVFTTNTPGGGGPAIHTRTEDFFVVGVEINGSAGTFTFNPANKELSVTFDGTIADQEIIVTYRLFFADYDIIASNDLSLTGHSVEYKGLVTRIPDFSTQLNFASSNKTVIGTGSLSLDNSTGFFNELLNLYRFENKEFSAYSWSPDLPITEHKIIYRGTTEKASLSSGNLGFTIKDSIFSLNNQLTSTQFTSSEVIENQTNRFKKQIFGRVNGMAVQSVSQVGNGYILLGTIRGSANESTLTGTNTDFLDQLAPGDKIEVGGTSLTVRSVVNSEFLVLANALNGDVSITNALVIPSKAWYNTNRRYSVAGHALKRFETTIQQFVDTRRLGVASASGFAIGDEVIISNETYSINTISKVYTDAPTNSVTRDVIVLDRTLSGNNFPNIGDTIVSREVFNVAIDNVTNLLNADVTTVNTDNSESFMIISNDAEQEVAPLGVFGNDLTAVSNSRFFILGTPTIQVLNFSNVASQTFRGISFQLGKADDDTTASGDFLWFGKVENIREFTTTAAANVTFEPGDIYLDTTNEEYIGIKTSRTGPGTVDVDHINLGTTEPIRVQIPDSADGDAALVSNIIETSLSVAKTIQLFAFNSAPSSGDFEWKFFTNQGSGIVGNTFSPTGGTNTTLNSNTTVTGEEPTLDISLSENLQPRDLIKLTSQSDFFQVIQAESKFVQVSEIITLDGTGTAQFKDVAYASDTSLVTVSALGQTFDGTITGEFVSTPSDACRKIFIDNGLSNFIDTNTFTEASINENLSLGIYAPFKITGQPPTLLQMINRITLTGLASVGLTSDFMLKYQLLNGFKQSDLTALRVINNNDVTNRPSEDLRPSPLFKYTIRNIDASYDIGEAEPNTKLIRLEDAKIGRLTDLNTTESIDLYTGNTIQATQIADRFLNYSQRFNRVVSFNGSLSVADVNIGEVVLLDFLELRNQQNNNIPFIGMVTEFSRNGKTVSMSVEDFGGLFTRSAGVTQNDIPTFTNSSEREKLVGTFLTDDNGLINNDETTLGNNILP